MDAHSTAVSPNVFVELVMTQPSKRIAVNFGGGYVPGLNAVIAGTVLAADELGWEVLGVQDGYDGLLYPGSIAPWASSPTSWSAAARRCGRNGFGVFGRAEGPP